jgi:hypothetical protein
LRTMLFSHQSTGQADPTWGRVARPPAPDHPDLEHQQALLLAVLRRAGGAPVSYSELKDAGVEFPASVVSELELAGVAIDRCLANGPGSSRQVGVRLLRAADPDPGPVDAPPTAAPTADVPSRRDWEPIRVYRVGVAWTLLEGALAAASRLVAAPRRWAQRARPGRPAGGGRMLAPLAVLAAAAVAGAIVLTALPGGGGAGVRSARAGSRASVTPGAHEIFVPQKENVPARNPARTTARSTPPVSARTASTATTSTTPTSTGTSSTPTSSASTASTATTSSPATQPSPASSSPASAPDLEARGHELMVAGQYDQAVPILQQALRATAEHPGACLEPTTQTCLTYAFAMFDLGRSLRLAGDPATAVPVLEHRLQIDNQRPVVAAELAQARQQASQHAG